MSSRPEISPQASPAIKPRKSSSRRKRKNTKLTGERSEAAFLARATDLGFGIAKPWGDCRRYDFILDNGECLHRIQVKCTESIRARAYETRATYTVGKGRAVYTKDDIDFIAAHVVPLDIWYILPVEICTPAPMLRFYPHRKAKIMRLEPYREAWHLILPKHPNHVMDIHAAADDTVYPDDACVAADAFVRQRGRKNEGAPPFAIFEGWESVPSEAKTTGTVKSKVCHSAPGAKPCKEPDVLSEEASETERLEMKDSPYDRLTRYRNLCSKTPAVKVPPSLAPWPIPPLKILVPREGKHILPNPPAKREDPTPSS